MELRRGKAVVPSYRNGLKLASAPILEEGLSATLRPEARPLKLGAVHGGQQPRLMARQAVELLEVDMAILAYRECGDADRVAFLDRLVQLEDVPMLQPAKI
ncbi:WD repeat-containing protein 19 [Perkinsus olseni]|uniref:WD repeat-containing protein 19 n=1 Tax=Perkinsus olseni TaxID=32597 RepID=A0A7J6P8A3_PEROL|nr:WD repeat-containing protein 19 [Perkinsus olseni]